MPLVFIFFPIPLYQWFLFMLIYFQILILHRTISTLRRLHWIKLWGYGRYQKAFAYGWYMEFLHNCVSVFILWVQDTVLLNSIWRIIFSSLIVGQNTLFLDLFIFRYSCKFSNRVHLYNFFIRTKPSILCLVSCSMCYRFWVYQFPTLLCLSSQIQSHSPD